MRPPNYILHPFRPIFRRKRRSPPGSSPGQLLGVPDAEPPGIRVLAYGPAGCTEKEIGNPDGLEELRELHGRWPVIWVEVDGIEHAPTVHALGQIFGLHRLALEDVVSVPQRAKVEDYGKFLFIVGRMAQTTPALETEQLGIFLGSDFVLTFQERPGDPFDPIRERIRTQTQGKIRNSGADYLAYAILDAAIDHYFPVLEELGERLEHLEEEIVHRPRQATMQRLYTMKRDLTALRRSLWPMRDATNMLVRDPHELVDDETRIYLRDTHDHVIQNIDLVESFRDLAASLTDLYLSTVSQRTNEIMKVLTVITAIFVPLSFVAGVYGMNFDPEASPFNMPELGWRYGYPFALGVMFVIGLLLVLYFHHRGWIGDDER